MAEPHSEDSINLEADSQLELGRKPTAEPAEIDRGSDSVNVAEPPRSKRSGFWRELWSNPFASDK
ncbi:MAG: hypothetical protein ACREJB_11960 [Planctomycetaceae bacterium]